MCVSVENLCEWSVNLQIINSLLPCRLMLNGDFFFMKVFMGDTSMIKDNNNNKIIYETVA